eukprot:1316282-Alexandrium_andersonii.AAC.1
MSRLAQTKVLLEAPAHRGPRRKGFPFAACSQWLPPPFEAHGQMFVLRVVCLGFIRKFHSGTIGNTQD